MSNADEMFEKLGYKETERNYKQIARYRKDDDNVICFNEDRKFNKTGEYDGMCDNITMQELQAINEKCRELGWIE